MQGSHPLKTLLRTAKPAQEIPTDPDNPEGTSTTILPVPTRLFSGGSRDSYDVTFRIEHTGGPSDPDVFLIWKGYNAGTDPTPTTKVSPGETREFTLAALALPFHVVVAPGESATACKVDRFYSHGHRPGG